MRVAPETETWASSVPDSHSLSTVLISVPLAMPGVAWTGPCVLNFQSTEPLRAEKQ